ncbi:MAG: dihydrodipicolinate synthase family protein [Chloroflexota bacterium]
MSKITGIFNILATPFDAEQQVDTDSLRNLVNFQINMGAHGLTILGVMGEAAKLTVDERTHVMQTVIETVGGRVPVVVGTSHPDTTTCIDLSKAAFAGGADGVMIAPPPMENATDDDIYKLYTGFASAFDGAIVVQDYPKVNGVFMSPEVIAKIANEIPAARYLKLEDPPLMEKTRAIKSMADDIEIFGGLGGMFLLEELNAGTSGTMTGFAFTEILIAIFDAFNRGDTAKATEIFDHYLPLIRYENQPEINLTIRKELLYRRGAMAHTTPRNPFRAIDTGTHEEIGWAMTRVGIDDPTQKVKF